LDVIEVVQPGAFTSVQGDRAWRQAHLGVPLGGPADAGSHAVANRLVGNSPVARALEITLLGPTLSFREAAVVALCGAPFEASIPAGVRVAVPAGERISIRGTPRGARCYLAVAGGIEAVDGRVLAKGETLAIGPAPAMAEAAETVAPMVLEQPVLLHYMSDTPRADLVYEVTNEANRRGIRLQGPPLGPNREIITEGVNAGTIQVPPSGQPLILFYDQTTTGGYPKLGTIVRADLDRVGQLRPRDQVILRHVPFA
jgi:antagonist of KipI